MIVGTASLRPMKFPLCHIDGCIVDAGEPPLHQAALVKFPILIAIGPEPIAAVVMPFIGKAYRDAIVAK